MKIKFSKFKSFGNKKIGILSPFYLDKHFDKFNLKRFFLRYFKSCMGLLSFHNYSCCNTFAGWKYVRQDRKEKTLFIWSRDNGRWVIIMLSFSKLFIFTFDTHKVSVNIYHLYPRVFLGQYRRV